MIQHDLMYFDKISIMKHKEREMLMNTSFLIIVNPIIAILVSLLFYFTLGNIYDIPMQETAAIHIGLVLFFILVVPCYLLTIVFWHFQKKRFATYSVAVNILIGLCMTYYLINVHFFRIHFPLEMVILLIISFVPVSLISLYGVFGIYRKVINY